MYLVVLLDLFHGGGVAQMVERSLSMREVPGSIPGASKFFFSPGSPTKWEPSILEGGPGRASTCNWSLYDGDKKFCIVRESNPGRPRGRRAFYH